MAEVSFVGVGVWELVLIFLLGGGLLPVPVGVPPLAEDPALLRVAPDGSLLFVEWFGAGNPDPASPNRTERIAANREVRELFRTIEEAVRRGIRDNARGSEGRLAEEAFRVISTAVSKPGALFVSSFDIGARAVPIEGGVVLSAGDALPELRSALEAVESLILREMSGGDASPAARTIDVEGNSFRVLPLSPEVPPVAWGVVGDYVVLGVGEGLPARIVKALGAGGAGPPVGAGSSAGGGSSAGAASAGGKGSMARRFDSVRVERPMGRAYVDIAGLLEKVGAMGGPGALEALDALGLRGVTALVSESGLEADGFVSRSLIVTTGAPTGLLELADGAPLTDDDLAVIPRDATIAAAIRLDLLAAYRQLLAVLDRVEPNARREIESQLVEELEDEIGLRLVEDVLEPLGDVWTVWSAPSEGGLLVTGLTAAVRVKDRQRAARALDRFVAVLQKEMGAPDRASGGGRRRPRGVFLESFTFAGTKVHYLNAVGEEMPVAPAWCLTDTHLMVSLYPQMLKASLARGARVERSLAKHPALAERGAACAVSYADVAGIFRIAYPLLHPLAQMGLAELQRGGIDLTIAALPSASAILPHLGPSVGTVERTSEGILCVSRGRLPATGLLGAGAFIPFLAPVAAYSGVKVAPPPSGTPAPFPRVSPPAPLEPPTPLEPQAPPSAPPPLPPPAPPPQRRRAAPLPR